jgi:uncharacterized protein YutE (UPF0331/DUF86 family)
VKGPIDRARVAAHLDALEDALRGLHGRGDVTPERLSKDRDLRWLIAHGLQLAIQNVLDIATHLCTALGVVPEHYRDAAAGLGDLGVLEPGLAQRIVGMAGLRNVLVHGYLALDLQRLAQAVEQLEDFAAFEAAVTAFLDANPEL